MSRATRHSRNARRSGSRASVDARDVSTGRGLEVRPAMRAVADAALRRPAVREDAVDAVLRDDLAVDGIHELEVVRPERARDPQLRIGPMASRLAVGVNGYPVGVRRPHLVTHGVRIGPRDHVHLQAPASGDERAERIGAAEPCAPMVERHLGRVVRDDAAGAETGGVGPDPREVVEPEVGIEAPGVVFDERQLRPPHRSIEPAGQRVAGHRARRRTLDGAARQVGRHRVGARPSGGLEEVPPRQSVGGPFHAGILRVPRLDMAPGSLSGSKGTVPGFNDSRASLRRA